ncbi:MAG: hypothetical protein ACXVAX_09375 [Pseudobdellovibrio sp.]
MKKLVFTAALLLASFSAHADIIKCNFTEPFVVSSYSMAQQSLTYYSNSGPNGEQVVNTIKNVSFQIKDAGVFELVGADGKVLQTLTLSKKGSDGMSDNVYPYDVKDNSMNTMANSGYGGCQSNALKVKIQN